MLDYNKIDCAFSVSFIKQRNRNYRKISKIESSVVNMTGIGSLMPKEYNYVFVSC